MTNCSEFFALLTASLRARSSRGSPSWDDEQLKLVQEYLQRVRQQNSGGPRPNLEETPEAVTELAAKTANKSE